MQKNKGHAPPAALVAAWEKTGLIAPEARWLRQSGGHSNPVWRVGAGERDHICKLYQPENHSPLFGNDPDLEAIALTALAGEGIAPRLISRLECDAGKSLAYSYLPGPQWRGDVGHVARLMSRLHAVPAPDALPRIRSSPDALVAQTREMQPDMVAIDLGGELPPEPQPVFLHGDVVPGNLVETDDGLRLIDWQCPAAGDPCLDIAIFLSPAMQVIYGHRALSDAEVSLFFQIYGRPEVTRRYQVLAPLFHARMAAYCLWKGARGSAAHAAAAALELQALK
ncbi:phosphotransferase [Aliiroseovarius crassostreae]|uniref:phosphotransferase n=1 Tax=Aliiroseovarius crassostreae TaxID=154981 RepID=UPI003C7C4655